MAQNKFEIYGSVRAKIHGSVGMLRSKDLLSRNPLLSQASRPCLWYSEALIVVAQEHLPPFEVMPRTPGKSATLPCRRTVCRHCCLLASVHRLHPA